MKIILIILISTLAFSYNKIYVGNDDQGRLIAGVVSGMNVKALTLETEIYATQTVKGPEIFQPNIINFAISAEYDNIKFRHSCEHGVNEWKDIDITDTIYLEFKSGSTIKGR